MSGFHLSPLAEVDLDSIWWYVAEGSQNPDRADEFVSCFYSFFERLSQTPYMGRPRDDLRAGVRSFAVGDYIVLYRVFSHGVFIARIVHGSQDIDTMFSA